MCDVIDNLTDERTLRSISEKVKVLCNSFPVYTGEDDEDDMTMKATALRE